MKQQRHALAVLRLVVVGLAVISNARVLAVVDRAVERPFLLVLVMRHERARQLGRTLAHRVVKTAVRAGRCDRETALLPQEQRMWRYGSAYSRQSLAHFVLCFAYKIDLFDTQKSFPTES